MIGMGSTITVQDILDNFKKPIGPIIGLSCQFLIMPFLGWSLAMGFDLEPEVAIGTLAIATCPGGTLSNVMTYLTDGDTCLSIMMTTFSNVFAIGFMPLWLFIYSRSWIEAAASLPYLDIIIALILILFPGAFGMLIRWKLPRYAPRVALVCSVISLLGIVGVLTMIGIMNHTMFMSSWQPYVVSFLLATVGFVLAYIISLALRQGHKKARTIAFETGIQNSALALTVINITILRTEGLESVKMGLVPSLHGIISFAFYMALAGCYLLYKKSGKMEEFELNGVGGGGEEEMQQDVTGKDGVRVINISFEMEKSAGNGVLKDSEENFSENSILGD
ncbi:ileal sodium/bile acid cotransporter-like [Glandiceps talaboti]